MWMATSKRWRQHKFGWRVIFFFRKLKIAWLRRKGRPGRTYQWKELNMIKYTEQDSQRANKNEKTSPPSCNLSYNRSWLLALKYHIFIWSIPVPFLIPRPILLLTWPLPSALHITCFCSIQPWLLSQSLCMAISPHACLQPGWCLLFRGDSV